MGERLLCKQEVVGSIPSASTRPLEKGWVSRRWMVSQRSAGRNHNTVTCAEAVRTGSALSADPSAPSGIMDK